MRSRQGSTKSTATEFAQWTCKYCARHAADCAADFIAVSLAKGSCVIPTRRWMSERSRVANCSQGRGMPYEKVHCSIRAARNEYLLASDSSIWSTFFERRQRFRAKISSGCRFCRTIRRTVVPPRNRLAREGTQSRSHSISLYIESNYASSMSADKAYSMADGSQPAASRSEHATAGAVATSGNPSPTLVSPPPVSSVRQKNPHINIRLCQDDESVSLALEAPFPRLCSFPPLTPSGISSASALSLLAVRHGRHHCLYLLASLYLILPAGACVCFSRCLFKRPQNLAAMSRVCGSIFSQSPQNPRT